MEHTYQVLNAIDEVVALVDGETALRGYLLTHEASFLRPYDGVGAQATARRHARVARQRQPGADGARQALRTLVIGKISEMAAVRADDDAANSRRRARMAEGRGRELMSRARDRGGDAHRREPLLLAERGRQADLARRAGLGFGILSVFVAGVLGLVGITVNIAFERRRLAFEEELAGRLAAERSAAVGQRDAA